MSQRAFEVLFLVSLLPLGLGSAGRAEAQVCPSDYTTCDNGGCCLSSEQCCPTAAQGCCSSAAPYCCGDGTCAATPSQCLTAGGAVCDGYDVPCGGGCAPAGSDCCDLAGHYCPPESMCTSDTTCVFGATPTLAREVAVIQRPDEVASGERLSPPFRDPEDATARSCALGRPATRDPAPSAWLVLASGLLVGGRRYLRRARSLPRAASGATVQRAPR